MHTVGKDVYLTNVGPWVHYAAQMTWVFVASESSSLPLPFIRAFPHPILSR
jgi:hypothetical protein